MYTSQNGKPHYVMTCLKLMTFEGVDKESGKVIVINFRILSLLATFIPETLVMCINKNVYTLTMIENPVNMLMFYNSFSKLCRQIYDV